MSPALDSRLALAASLYIPCELGADIGTDHGLLPCHLLRKGICRRMILTDISPKALRHAREQVERQGLAERAILRCADGLEALTEPVGCLSVTGMGGKTLAGILRGGQDRLGEAALVLSCHTDQAEARRAVTDIGWHFTREEVCLSGGRYYLVWRAEKGSQAMTAQELRLGPLWREKKTEEAVGYARHRLWTLARKREGLETAAVRGEAEEALLRETAEDMALLSGLLKDWGETA